jgi:hypothetical protein
MANHDPGKGSKRRPGDSETFAENFEKIFGKKKVTPGRRYYKWVSREGFVEIPPPAPLSSDLRFDDTFVSPVTGEVISNKVALDRHNKENKVTQILPGMEQDQAAIRADRYDKAFGKQAQKERIQDVIQAVEKHT